MKLPQQKIRGMKMLVTLVEVVENKSHYSSQRQSAELKGGTVYSLREVTINPAHVVCLREDTSMVQRLAEGRLPSDLDSRQKFTKVYLDRGQSGIDLTVVGSLVQTKENLGIDKRELLNG